MKKTLLFILASILLYSCTLTYRGLKGKYNDEPYAFNSPRPFDTVWSNLIDLFATKGLPISLIDKGDGFIISDRSSFPYTFENKKFGLIDSTAYIVVGTMEYGSEILKPSQVNASWNVRIKPTGTGCLINVNVTNIESNFSEAKNTYKHKGKSTGVFEKMIANSVK